MLDENISTRIFSPINFSGRLEDRYVIALRGYCSIYLDTDKTSKDKRIFFKYVNRLAADPFYSTFANIWQFTIAKMEECGVKL